MIQRIQQQSYKGTIVIPPSKSDSQRAILCAGLAFGTSILKNVGISADELAMIATIRKFGARIQYLNEKELEVRGVGGLLFNSTDQIEVGESGLGVRLLTAIASTSNLEVSIQGEGSLLKRDLSFFERVLPQMGVQVTSNNGKLPLKVKGPIQGGNYNVDGSESSQYISGLLMAFPFSETDTQLNVENLKSKLYVQMTLATLKSFGISVHQSSDVFTIPRNQNFSASDYQIDGDWSSASCWLAASALGCDISVQGLSLSSLQADKQLLNAFLVANCQVIHSENGISIEGKNRKAFHFDATDCPDLFPALTVFAVLTEGESRIKGIHRLANKESDRASTLKSEFEKLGASIRFEGDEMCILGGKVLKGTTVSSHNDHRIAMCLAIAGMFTSEEIEIHHAESVAKSYPDFWMDLERLA